MTTADVALSRAHSTDYSARRQVVALPGQWHGHKNDNCGRVNKSEPGVRGASFQDEPFSKHRHLCRWFHCSPGKTATPIIVIVA